MSRLSTLISEPKQLDAMSAQQKSFVTYTIPMVETGNDRTTSITILESRAIISSSGTTGFRTWEAALYLSAWLAESDVVKGKSVLELGAGTGLVSLLCTSHLGASRVIATDGNEGLIEELKTNIFLNNVSTGPKFDVAVFQWGNTPLNVVSRPGDDDSKWDLIVGADIVSV
jgi:predicted nicotinamide N-methyase